VLGTDLLDVGIEARQPGRCPNPARLVLDVSDLLGHPEQ
jgi:hypothetical protein